jgi:hypothetical protein
MAGRIQLRRGTAANWTATNPTLAVGEPGIETDTGKMKIGDGTTAWATLEYIDAGSVDHVADTTGAHAATAISYAGSAGLSATTVEAALDELDTEKASTGSVTTVSDGLVAHLADGADAHDASAISVLDTAGRYTATDVEGVLAELHSQFVLLAEADRVDGEVPVWDSGTQTFVSGTAGGSSVGGDLYLATNYI